MISIVDYSLLQDLKHNFEQNEEKLVGVIELFNAGLQVALNLTIFVTLRLPHPNQIISNLLDLFDLFSPDMRQLDVVISL